MPPWPKPKKKMLRRGYLHVVVRVPTTEESSARAGAKSWSASMVGEAEEKVMSEHQWNEGASEPVMRAGMGVGAWRETPQVWGSARFLAGGVSWVVVWL